MTPQLASYFGAKDGVLPELTAGTGTIGLRVPGSALARDLIRFIGHALTGTSANLSGCPNLRTAQEAAEEIGRTVERRRCHCQEQVHAGSIWRSRSL